jgi:hypothetical protein
MTNDNFALTGPPVLFDNPRRLKGLAAPFCLSLGIAG